MTAQSLIYLIILLILNILISSIICNKTMSYIANNYPRKYEEDTARMLIFVCALIFVIYNFISYVILVLIFN